MIKLDSNENQLQHLLNIKDIVTNIDPRFYPDVTISDLKLKISEKYNIPVSEIFCSNGSDNLIKIITFCLMSYKDEVLIPEIAFPTYEIAAKMKECYYKLIPLNQHGIDLNATLNAISDKTKLIWVSNPHNPTGTFITKPALQEFLDKVPNHIYVVLDEAYIEYVTDNCFDSFDIYKQYPNVILLRTFSKVHGLAGARVGYGFAREEIVNKLSLGLGPFDVNSYAQKLAYYAVNDDEYVRLTKETTATERAKYESLCNTLNLEYIKSHTSFLMIKFNDISDVVCDYLLSHNIIVKNGSKIGMPGWIRISIGTKEQNDLTIKLLSNITSLF